MEMHNPPHPGEVIRELCLEPLGLSVTAAAPGSIKVWRPTSPIGPETTAEVAAYLASVGLVVSETNRRAVIAERNRLSENSMYHLKQAMLKFIYSSPRRTALFRRFYGQLG